MNNLDKCWNCEKHPVERKDYRPDSCGGISKVFVCSYCAHLNDVQYHEVHANSKDPKDYWLTDDNHEQPRH
jgi:hypothetical protein